MNNYDILGIPKGANKDTIKKAYRKLALKHHPDRKNGNSDRFLQLQKAYEELLQGKTGELEKEPETYSQWRQRAPWENFRRDFFSEGSIRIVDGKLVKGTFELVVEIKQGATVRGLDELKHMSWSLYEIGTQLYRFKIKKEDLRKCDYLVKLRFEFFDGNFIDKEIKVKKPKPTFTEKVGNLMAKWYGLD